MRRSRRTGAAWPGAIGAGLTAIALAGAAAQEPAEEPGFTFRVEVNYVEIDVRVVDADGAFVRDLGRDEFEILEDGERQALTNFALVDIPVERRTAPLLLPDAEPDVSTNAREFDGRLYMIVMDDLHTSAHRTQLARNAARRFIETRLGTNDLASVLTVQGGSTASQPFTDNVRLLLEAVDAFIGRKLPSETAARLSTPESQGPGGTGPSSTDPVDVERSLNAEASLRTLRNAAEFMAPIQGRRKALVYISEGIDYDVTDFTRRGSFRVAASIEDTIAAATRANVAIYPIDPRGLTTLGDDLIELSSTTATLGINSLQQEFQRALITSRSVADGTGGFAAVNTNNLETAFDRIVSENSAYYMLGYYPVNDRRDGQTRNVTVRVTRPGVEVFHRGGYVEPEGDEPAPPAFATDGSVPTDLVDAIRSPLPLSDLTLSSAAVPFKGTDGRQRVVIVTDVGPDGVGLRPDEDGKQVGRFEVAAAVLESGGKLRGSERIDTRLRLEPATLERMNAGGLRTVFEIGDLRPGRYQVRVGGWSETSGRRGSVFVPLEIPDFEDDPLAMSGLLIGSAGAARGLTAGLETVDVVATGLAAVPTAARQFAAADVLFVYVEVYDNRGGPTHAVDLSARVAGDDGTLAFTSEESRSSAELGNRAGGYGYRTLIPLREMAPGAYVLTLEARSRLAGIEPAIRHVPFRVVE